MYELKICHLYPDLMRSSGDRGSLIALYKRCQWRGIEVRVSNISINDPLNYNDYDIFFIGGGQAFEQSIIKEDLNEGKKHEIIEAIEAHKIFFAVCGGFQLLGKYYRNSSDQETECIGALDIWTHECDTRLVGNLVFEVDFLSEQDKSLRGFENHSGKIYLGKGVKPLGQIVTGHGNNGQDGHEGARYKNTFCTNSHGSLLPTNPAFTDHLIMLSLLNKYPDFQGLTPLNNELENRARTQGDG
ncbi:MAG: glutamine amidotransferase [Clostridiaceae bacterium]|jgi:CobQ-like glutamine amidotransferase family enzyme|nr:glutamine amidotransferase [Clostridiaceae bacterium]